MKSSRMGPSRQRDCREWQRINDRRYRRLDVANVIWFGVGIVWMLRMGCEGESEGKREVKQKNKKGLKVI